MSIPIPLVLALLSRSNSNMQRYIPNKSQSTALTVQNSKQTPMVQIPQTTKQNVIHTVKRPANNQYMISRLSNIAGLIGGPPGAKISKVANVIKTINNVNQPINALSLLSGGNKPANILNMFSKNKTFNNNKNAPNVSKMYNNINNMLSNMDNDKKEDLLSMAKNLMGNISNES